MHRHRQSAAAGDTSRPQDTSHHRDSPGHQDTPRHRDSSLPGSRSQQPARRRPARIPPGTARRRPGLGERGCGSSGAGTGPCPKPGSTRPPGTTAPDRHMFHVPPPPHLSPVPPAWQRCPRRARRCASQLGKNKAFPKPSGFSRLHFEQLLKCTSVQDFSSTDPNNKEGIVALLNTTQCTLYLSQTNGK